MIFCSLQFITGFMVGIEFPAQDGIVCVVDLGIMRILIERYDEEGNE